MQPLVILSLSIFIISFITLYKVSIKYFKNNNSDKMWKIWGIRSSYYEGLIIVSFAITSVIILGFKYLT
jgi:hypothetical protein